MLMSHSASSAWLTGLPRWGDSARTAPATSATMPSASTNRRVGLLGVDMPHLALRSHRPARDGIEVVTREAEHRRRLGGLSAPCHELRAGRLRVAGLVPGPALQD